jgi:hypothetical protein
MDHTLTRQTLTMRQRREGYFNTAWMRGAQRQRGEASQAVASPTFFAINDWGSPLANNKGEGAWVEDNIVYVVYVLFPPVACARL